MSQQIPNRATEAKLNELKEVLRAAFLESGITEEALADDVKTTQPTINRWFSYKTEYFPPLWLLSFAPEAIVVPVCEFFLKRFKKSIMQNPLSLHLNGSMDDEIFDSEILLADIIKYKNSHPEKVVRLCDKLIYEAQELKEEAGQIVEKNKPV